MTLQEAYEYGRKQLELAGVPDADLDAWYLLEFVTKIDRAMYFAGPQHSISASQETLYREYIRTRKSRVPLQHITGVQEFMGLEFFVNEHVLVPRQDTETLVECVLKELTPEMKVLDMCTGSGCILISLMKLGGIKHGVGIDISEEALTVAGKNRDRHFVEMALIQSNLFENVSGRYDVIVSNPPYIPTSVIEKLEEEVRVYEPGIALDGKEDGLYFYREIVKGCPEHLSSGGRLFFEIGHDQGEAVKSIMEQAGFLDVTVKKDLAGLDRVVCGKYNY